MIQKDDAISELKARLELIKDSIALKTFKHNPTKPFDVTDVPGISIMEGPDGPIKKSNRSIRTNVGEKRIAEIILEWAYQESDSVSIRKAAKEIRAAVLKDPFLYVEGKRTDVHWQESHFEGPLGYGVPGVQGMRLILELNYTDIEEL